MARRDHDDEASDRTQRAWAQPNRTQPKWAQPKWAQPDWTRRELIRRGVDLSLLACASGAWVGCRDDGTSAVVPAVDSAQAAATPGALPGSPSNPDVGSKLLRFEGIASHSGFRATVPEGYRVDVLAPWGSPLFPDSAVWRDDGSNSGADQATQVGDNHDGMHFFPIDAESSREGLLVVNHEYCNYEYLFGSEFLDPWTEDKVKKAQHAHGVSVLHIQRGDSSRWSVKLDSPYNRRITARTPMLLTGPAAGHTSLRTGADPEGVRVLGTLNNCSNGATPWGTYLTCEENFHLYFGTAGEVPKDEPAERVRLRERYGIRDRSIGYRWEEFDERFDFAKEPNESNRFGWVVEIDPFDRDSTPKKRTALGRFKHENAALTLAADGRVVVYMGDDEPFNYIYKFVSEGRFVAGADQPNRELLEQGRLYVARFGNGDREGDRSGTGEWLLLDKQANPVLAADARFEDQAAVLVQTRLAADALGATPMDRPEWIAVHPTTADVYCTLTNNAARKGEQVDDANPRAENLYGQIIRWSETGGDPTASSFDWNLFVVAGNPVAYPDRSDLRSGSSNVTPENHFNGPDGLGIDPSGKLWILTDGRSSNSGEYTGQGNNQLLCADPQTGEIRRFLVGPGGCEITGITWTPDLTTLFVNVQHPGDARGHPEAPGLPFGLGLGFGILEYLSRNPTAFTDWPKNQFPEVAGGGRPRSATLVITRADKGPV